MNYNETQWQDEKYTQRECSELTVVVSCDRTDTQDKSTLNLHIYD